MLLSNLYRGIVVENIVAPKNFEYPEKFDDLKYHSFHIFAIESFDNIFNISKSAFYRQLKICIDRRTQCSADYTLSKETQRKLFDVFKKVGKNSRFHIDTDIMGEKIFSGFKRRVMDVYSANIIPVYEKYIQEKLTFEQAETEGKKFLSEYLYEQTQSIESRNLNGVFEEIMSCNNTVFVDVVEYLKEIKRALPTRSVKTGQKFFTSETHGFEANIRYSLPDTGSATSDDKVPRNFRAIFESGIFNVWKNFFLRLKSRNLRIRTKREAEVMKLESRVRSLFMSFFGFAFFLSIILLVEKVNSILEKKFLNAVAKKIGFNCFLRNIKI